MSGVTLTLTGSGADSTLSDGSGNYTFSSLVSGGTYTVTPSKAGRTPASPGINAIDIVAVERHYLQFALLSGCRLAAADVNGDNLINVLDLVAMQRFFLGFPTGTAHVGKYVFVPASRTYSGVVSDQTAQNFDALVLGDVVTPFADRPGGPSQDSAGEETSVGEVPASVTAIALPNVTVDRSMTNFVAGVAAASIDARNHLVGFQGDLTFDSRVVNFESEPVRPAGLTGSRWNVSGNVLDGPGPIRTLRIAGFSLDFTPLSGSGTLFELRMTGVNKTTQTTQLLWAAPPDHFIFIDTDLNTQRPGYTGPGSIAPSDR